MAKQTDPRWRRRRVRHGLFLGLALALLTTLFPGSPGTYASARSQVDGNTYTSPTYGYSLTWDDSWWLLTDFSTTEFEYVTLTNGGITVSFGGANYGGALECVLATTQLVSIDENNTDYAVVPGPDGEMLAGDDSAASVTVTFVRRGEMRFKDYISCHAIVPGESAFWALAAIPETLYDSQQPLVVDLLDGLSLGGGAPEPEEHADPGPADRPSDAPEQFEPGVQGTRYLSPRFGYRITWDPSWIVWEESSNEVGDFLGLRNGQGTVLISSSDQIVGEPSELVDQFFELLRAQDPTLRPMLDEAGDPVRGGDTTSFRAIQIGTHTENGVSFEVAQYYEARVLEPGFFSTMVGIMATIPMDQFDAQMTSIRELLDRLELAPPGEPAPVAASGQWRIAGVAAFQDASIAQADLEPKAGKDWVVVVVDVSNMSDSDATLSIEDVTLRIEGSRNLKQPAMRTTAAVADAFESQPTDADAGISFDPGQTRRLVLVYQIAEGAEVQALVTGTTELSLPSLLQGDHNLRALRPVIQPAALEPATLIRVVDGQTIKIRFDESGDEEVIELAGVEAPVGDDCYAGKATTRLKGLVGEELLIEVDASIVPGERPRYYVWSMNESGDPVLVNHAMVAAGHAYADDGDADARFGLWIAAADDAAEDADAPIWKACAAA